MPTETTPVKAPPSWFSKQGVPTCSMWWKLELELLAWAYVTALANSGDTWRPLTSIECYQLLDEEERRFVSPYLDKDGADEKWWGRVSTQLKDSDGAFAVEGLTWGRWRFDLEAQPQPAKP
jgi:hypothetical protein